MTPQDRVELLAVLAADPDPSVAERAQSVLLTQPVESFIGALERPNADVRLCNYCADNLAEKPGMADALAKCPSCPTPLLAQMAPRLTAAGIEALLGNLERLSSDPRLIAAVVHTPAATAEQKELLEDLLKGAPSMSELEQAAADAVPDIARRQTLLQRLAHMNVVERITLALKGGREERMLLIRDRNKIVQRAVMQSPRLTDNEVEAFAGMTNVTGEVLRTISLNRFFMKSYTIAKNLVLNPKTPLDVSLHLLPRLNATDLKLLTVNKNIPETLRSMAVKLQRQRKSVTSNR